MNHGPQHDGAVRPKDDDPNGTRSLVASDVLLLSSGQMVNHYRILQYLGGGGFGEVWLAEQVEQVQRLVAIKLIKIGMDTKEVIARFGLEKQALALMDHTGIAKILDAGSVAGRPYFVMDYIKGERLDDYCDRHKLPIRERLILAAKICDAVDHAHMKGLIHRDLKPSNILVTVPSSGSEMTSPRPVIIDFGIAKAIAGRFTRETIFTEPGTLMGTLDYMSPEQAEMGGTNVDLRTDVYSLGVVLYQLLIGMLPFDSHSLEKASTKSRQRTIREYDPPRPSTRLSELSKEEAEKVANARQIQFQKLTAELRSDLEWIPIKAMRKDRALRYESSAEMARDIRRYLAGVPLQAGPLSISYRLRKFLQHGENRVDAIFMVTGGLLLTLCPFITTGWRTPSAPVSSLDFLWTVLLLVIPAFLVCLGGSGFVLRQMVPQAADTETRVKTTAFVVISGIALTFGFKVGLAAVSAPAMPNWFVVLLFHVLLLTAIQPPILQRMLRVTYLESLMTYMCCALVSILVAFYAFAGGALAVTIIENRRNP